MHLPLPFAWPYLLLFWATYAWVFLPEFRFLGESAPAADRGSMQVVQAWSGVAILAAILLAFLAPRALLPGGPLPWFCVGLATMVVGGLLRRHCFRVLGAFFTGAVRIQADHRVIDVGAYRWVRHPAYSAALLIVLGLALSFGNWLGVAVSFPIAAAAYEWRARIEEQALLAALGPDYARFIATRKRFIPFLW